MRYQGSRFRLPTMLLTCFVLGPLSVSAQPTEIKAFESNLGLGCPFLQLIWDVKPQNGQLNIPPEYNTCEGLPGGVAQNQVFDSGVNFTRGMAYRGDTLYGLHLSQGGQIAFFLHTLTDTFCAMRDTTFGPIEVDGVPPLELESLAYVPPPPGTGSAGPIDGGAFYTATFSFDEPHVGRILRIDVSGIVAGQGTFVGDDLPTDVRIVGMAYDVSTDTLFALTGGFESRRPELLTVNRTPEK